ncbi:hypothetical protein IE53DRAFT_412961 [Violaceomyces palustris]|uniref:Uncharacterized protein n=1 Tax=Violaceomyces palustris TaxID=1673888 RepID=A0ACD0NP11_9BASI|nr:hypothetical protein IE53DRAFT_412961 [Violaceomyces palustris]
MCRSREPQFSRPALLTAAAIFAFAIPCLATANYENSNVFRLDRPTSQVYSSMGSLISTEGPLTSDGSSLSFDNHAIGLTQRYDKGRVFLSFFVSLFGSVATLELLLFRMRSTGWSSSFHLLAAGCAFGGGTTWAMHFITWLRKGNNALFLDFKLNAVDFPIPLDEELAKRFKDNVSLSFEDAQALLVARGNHSLPLTFEGKYTALSLLMTVALMMIAFALMGFQSPLEIFLWIHPYLSRRMELKRTKDSTAEPTGLESFPSTPGSEIDHAGLIGPPRQRTNSSVSTLVATNDHHETPVPDASMQKWQWIRRLSMFSTATSCRRQDTSRDLVESTTKEQDGILALQKQETRVERIEACPPVGGAIPKPSGTELVGCMHKAEPQTAPRRKKVEILDSQENDLVIAEPEADGDRTFADSSVDEIWYSRASGWDRGRTMRLVFAGALAGGAVSGMHYVGNLSVLFIRFRYRARFVILSTFISTFIVVTVFFVLFDLLKPKLLHRLWTRILLAFLLSGGGCLMHYSATLGTQYYITSRQMAAILLEPGFWRAGRIPRMLTIEVAASATVALSCLLALIAWVSHRRAERRKTTVKQHVILALFLFDVKTLKLLVNEDGMVPHVDVGPLVIPPGETGSPFMSPKLPPALSPPQVAKGLKLKLWSRVLHPFGLGVEKEEAEPEVTKLYEGHPLFARAIRTTWAWQQPRGQRGSVCYSSATTETRSSKVLFPGTSTRRQSCPERMSTDGDDKILKDLEAFVIGGPLPKSRKSSIAADKPAAEAYHRDLKRSYFGGSLFPSRTRRQPSDEECKFELGSKLGLSRAEQLFEVWPSNPSTGKSTLGVLYDKIVRLGGELGERELLILARPIISSTEAFQLTRRNHVFLDAITAGRKINQHLGTEVGPRLVGEVQSFVQTGMTLAGQLRKGWLYCGLLVIQSHLYDGLHVAVEPQSRHSLPMIELGTLERPDGAQPSTSLGTLEELNEAMRPDFVRSKKGAGRLAGLLVQNLVTYLDTTQPAEVVSHLLSRLVIVPQIVPLLEESTSSTYPELQNAYTIVFKAALSPDVEFSSLCWSPWNVFSAQNELG